MKKKLLFLKSDNPKHFSFIVFDFNVLYKISFSPTRLLYFQEFSNLFVYSKLTPVYYNFSSIWHSRTVKQVPKRLIV